MVKFTETIADKQKQYYKLQEELKEMISGAEGMDVRYKGQEGIIVRIYTDSTADVQLVDDEGKEREENVKLVDLD